MTDLQIMVVTTVVAFLIGLLFGVTRRKSKGSIEALKEQTEQKLNQMFFDPGIPSSSDLGTTLLELRKKYFEQLAILTELQKK